MYNQAIADYTLALESDPSFYIALVARADAYFKIGANEQSLKDYDKICAPRTSENYIWSIDVFANLEQYKDLDLINNPIQDMY